MSERLRIATFNLESLDVTRAGGPDLEARISVLCPQLERLEADILCLQEINAQSIPGTGNRSLAALDAVLSGTSYAPYHRCCTRGGDGDDPADRHNLVTLSRWPIVSMRQIRHDLVPPPLHRPVTARPASEHPEPVTWDRPILLSEIALPDEERLHVLNLHLRSPLAAPVPGQKRGAFTWLSAGAWAEGFFLATLKRTGQALEARLVVERIFDAEEEALIVVAGDYNAEARETPLRTLIADVDDTGNRGLTGRQLTPLERIVPVERRYSLIYGGRQVLLDHVLVSRRVARSATEVWIDNGALVDETETTSTPPQSFHAPIVAEFALPFQKAAR